MTVCLLESIFLRNFGFNQSFLKGDRKKKDTTEDVA